MGNSLVDPNITAGESFCVPETLSTKRRNVLAAMTAGGIVGGVGAAIPMACTMLPSERAKSLGGPITIDISNLKPGTMTIYEWRSLPVWVVYRTPEMIKDIEEAEQNKSLKLVDVQSDSSKQQKTCKNIYRSIKKEILVAIGICTHLGCSPKPRLETGTAEGMPEGWNGGFYCPCHGSIFDLSGRVFTSVPASTNLDIPPHYYVSDKKIYIGGEKA